MKPIIGVSAAVNAARNSIIGKLYIKAICDAGGVPVLLPCLDDAETLDSYVTLCDGFFFTGGSDVDPARYGESVHEACGQIYDFRDEYELALFDRAFRSAKPILGICRGIQLINVALGGSLYQDIPSERPSQISHRQSEPETTPSHSVNITNGTPLYALVGSERMKANSFHHQAIKKLGRGLEVMATADDGIVEAVYSLGEQYIRGYQWHPERLFQSDEQNRLLFVDFIDACNRKVT